MEMLIKQFLTTGNQFGFPKNDQHVYVSSKDLQSIGVTSMEAPVYVKIECDNILNIFHLYAKLAVLPNNLEMGEGAIWIPKEILPISAIVEKDTIANVSLLLTNELEVAESVTIKLDENLVRHWGSQEIQAAENSFRFNYRLFYAEQRVFIKPHTKDVVIGTVKVVYPKNGEPLLMGDRTILNFEGIPENREKTIDFSQIGGLSDVITRLREIIQIPLSMPEYLVKAGIQPPKGMIMYGPPGNGKTMIARAIAHSMGSSFISIDGPSAIMSKYSGQSEQNLRERFNEAESKGNAVLFIDEIDAIASIRTSDSPDYQNSLVATLLTCMDGLRNKNRVFVIGATNRLEAVDPALRRPGRFELEFEVPLPDTVARRDILSKYIDISNSSLFTSAINDSLLNILAEMTAGYSGADIAMLYREACMNALRKISTFDENTGKISHSMSLEEYRVDTIDFMLAMKSIVPTSLRGASKASYSVLWNDIIGLDSVKMELYKINSRLQILWSSDKIQSRPDYANVCLYGRDGTGKHTLTYAFAKRFSYELLTLDFSELALWEDREILFEISKIVAKARQMAPCIILIEGLSKVQDYQKYIDFILDKVNKLNKYLRILIFAFVRNETESSALIGYKKFATALSLELPSEVIQELITKRFGRINIANDATLGATIASILNQKILEDNQ